MRRTTLLLTVLTALAPPALASGIVQAAYLKASNTGASDHFGQVVAASGDTVVIAAPNEDSNAKGVNFDQVNNGAADAGAVYVYVHSGSTWLQQAYVKASNTEAGDLFGGAIAIDGNTLVVGAASEDSNATGVNGNQTNNSVTSAGAVYVFERAGSTWNQTAYLKASNPEMNDAFGISVAISGDTIVVGALGEDGAVGGVNGNETSNAASGAGAAYVFVRNAGTWAQQAYLKASAPTASDTFGTTVGIWGDTIVVGGPGEDSNASGVNGDELNNLSPQSGAAWVFARNGGTWTQQAFLKASTPEAADEFGGKVAISGTTIAVSAVGEDSDSTGVNGVEAFDFAPSAGAAWVFTRSGTTWTQQAYVKASNTETSDVFGTSIAIDGNTLVVGAANEDSNALGVDGDGSNNLAPVSGAAYAYTRSGSTWSPAGYLKASNTAQNDTLGYGCAVSSGWIAVGAIKEDSSAVGIDGDQLNNLSTDSGAAYVYTLPPSGPWTNMGSGLAGVAGVPGLSGSGTLAGGSLDQLDLSSAAPSATAALFLALSSTPTAFKGGTLLPVPTISMLFLGTNGAGAISLPFVMPNGIPAGTQLWMQWAIADTAAVQDVALSNGLRGITP